MKTILKLKKKLTKNNIYKFFFDDTQISTTIIIKQKFTRIDTIECVFQGSIKKKIIVHAIM